jgi:methionyl-tRNA formyltransferase
MYMSEGMDEWDILSIKKVPIETRDKTEDIFKKFEEVWPELLIKTLKQIINWEIQWKTQEESEATYCSKIMKTDGEIDFSQETAQVIYNKFRAYSTWPWIYTYYKWKKFSIEDCDILVTPWEKYKNWEVIKWENKQIWIACREWTIVLKQVKLEWKKSMDILSFINGNKDFLDHKF